MMSDGFWSRDFSVTNYGQLYYMLACWQATGSRCIFVLQVLIHVTEFIVSQVCLLDALKRVTSVEKSISHECSDLVISLNFSTDSNKRRT